MDLDGSGGVSKAYFWQIRPEQIGFGRRQALPSADQTENRPIGATETVSGTLGEISGLVGQWFVPEPDGSSREDLEFSFDGPGPTREQRLSTFRIKDWVTNDDTYVYLIEWEEDGQYFVCDPKIKNEPDVSHPPAGGELPCANPQGAFQNRP